MKSNAYLKASHECQENIHNSINFRDKQKYKKKKKVKLDTYNRSYLKSQSEENTLKSKMS